jgi:hypothetical protein
MKTRMVIIIVCAALFVGILLGYGIRSATMDVNVVNRYCYDVGMITYANGSSTNFTQEYHETCSTSPLPQTP